MPVTRSKSGRSPVEKQVEEPVEEPSMTSGPRQEKVPSDSQEKGTKCSSRARSKRSVASRKRLLAELEAKERIAELEIKATEARRRLEEARLARIQQEEASESSISSGDDENEDASVRVEQWLNRTEKVNAAAEQQPEAKDEPPPHPQRTYGVTTLAEALTQALRASTREAPKFMQEIPIFTGRSEEWLGFRAAYNETRGFFSKTENIARLRRSLRGAALEAVNSLFISQAEPSAVLEALERRFGRAEALVISELEKLRSLPKLQDSPRDICIFACKYANIIATIEALGKVQYLYSPESLRTVIEKMSPILRNKWYDYAAFRKDDTPEMKKMVNFLNDEADKMGPYAPPEQVYERPAGRNRTEKAFFADKTENCPCCKSQEHAHLTDCSKFKNKAIEERWEIARKSRVCFKCLRSTHRRINCRAKQCNTNNCTMSHHHLLHQEKNNNNRLETITSLETTSAARGNHRRAFLKIAPITLSSDNATIHTYALLDEGSTVTIIDEALADTLGLKGPTDPMWVQGISGSQMKYERSRRVDVRVKGRYEEKEQTLRNARTVEKLNFTTQTVEMEIISACDHLKGLEKDLAYEEACPRILIGQDNWELIVSRQVRAGRHNQPAASLTLLGWVLHGNTTFASKTNIVAFCGHLSENHDLEEMMKKYFELDSIGIEPRKNREDPEDRAMKILENNTKRTADGKFETSLLWKEEKKEIPNNYEDTLKRLKTLEKKLDREPNLRTQYEERIENLFKSGYAEPAAEPPRNGRTWYLPHFAVVNPEKVKIRVVHDAAAKSAGISLNDLLLPGPDLLQSLPGVVMRFRQHAYAISADIREMFMQVKIREEDRDALRFLWRGRDRESAPQEYRMTSLIFGATSSPCTALYVKNKNAEEYSAEYPEAAQAIVRNHYMDDYLASYPSLEKAQKISKEVDFIQSQAGFELRGWVTNQPAALNHIPAAPGQATVPIGGSAPERTLGLLWDVREDSLGFKINLRRIHPDVIDCDRPPTKREALSLIMSLFDPLGLISPMTTPAKRIMQDTWSYGTGWDEKLPDELSDRWRQWLQHIKKIDELRVPRPYSKEANVRRRDLHTFVDASEEAYAAAVYLRVENEDGSVEIALVMAKSKVTPLKPTSIPRLELQAALIGARLADSVCRELEVPITSRTYWSDAKTALSWIRSEPRSFKTFVAHRLAEIEDLTKKKEWRWVPTADNVADDATRAIPNEFGPQHRWFTGPSFLYENEQSWPVETKITPTEDSERKKSSEISYHAGHAHPETGRHAHSKIRDSLPEIERFSSWQRLIRATGRVLQFIELIKTQKHVIAAGKHKKTIKNKEKDPAWANKKTKKKIVKTSSPRESTSEFINLEPRYLREAERLWLQSAQEDNLSAERECAYKGLCPPKDGRLYNIAIAIGDDGLLRVKGRIAAATNIDTSVIHPIIADGRHAYVRMYIQHVHRTLHHAGVEAVVNEIRQKLWVIRARPTVKTAIKCCGLCRMKKAKPTTPATGNLPTARLAHHARPFTFTGLDYFGPVEVTVGRRVEKRYVGLFTCMTSRAIHLELVTSLSTDAAVNAVRRFIARRGAPKELWSDNATAFRAADQELRTAAQQAVEKEVTARGIDWRFIPPASPFMGGAWERMVRTVKTALSSALATKRPREDVLTTVLAEVELTVNSRPLTHVATSPEDREALTPNHILLGPDCRTPPPGDFGPEDITARAHWKRAQAIADEFWRRWVREYLPTLQHRREPQTKGAPPQVGDLVIVGDPNHPRNLWPRGRVVKTFPGQDGEVRVVDVETSKGHVLRRPTKKIVVLPEKIASATAGECARQN